MKQLLSLGTLCILLLSFKNETNVNKQQTKYAYVTALEHFRDVDKQSRMLYTTVVEVRCNHGHNAVASQFLDYYNAELSSKDSYLSNNTYANVYDSYDEAVSKRRSSMAKESLEKKIISTFYVTCK
jgi:hypothetical protein